MATLKEIDTLITNIEAAGFRELTKQDIADIVYSLASVYAVMSVNEPVPGTQTMSGAWENITVWEDLRDTKGLSGSTTTGDFTVTSGAGGRFEVHGYIIFSADTAGIYRVRPRMIFADTSQAVLHGQHEKTLAIGEEYAYHVVGINAPVDSAVNNDKFALQVRGPLNAVITVKTGFVRVRRL